jgi:hypothetical protein
MSEKPNDNLNPLPIIGTNPFGFTRRHVSEAVAALEAEQAEMDAALHEADEKIRAYIARRKPVCERQLSTLRMPPEEILQYTKRIYDRISELGEMPEAEIVSKIREEFPNALDYYPLLRKKPWGYVLGQKITNAQPLES